VALIQLGALAVRTANALIVLVTHGYEAEAHPLKRRLSELFTREQVVVEDTTGEHARRWLEGRDQGSPGRLAQKQGVKEPYDFFTVGSHDDSRGVRFITTPPGWIHTDQAALNVHPHRLPLQANGLLYDAAHEATGMSVMLAEVFGEVLEIWPELSHALAEGRQWLELATRGVRPE
jgi:hypothetical protein